MASVQNQSYYSGHEQKLQEDRYTVIVNGDIRMYIVMDGHDSSRAADFALKRLPELLMASDLHGMFFPISSLYSCELREGYAVVQWGVVRLS